MTTDRAEQILQLLNGITSELDDIEATPDRLEEILANLKNIEAELPDRSPDTDLRPA